MALIAETKSGKDFEIPNEGQVQAVLAEVRDLGLLDQTYNGVSKKVHKVLFRWQLAELDAEKQPLRVYERFTLSLHEKAALRKRLKGILRKDPPATYDLEKLVGINVNLIIEHNHVEGKEKPFANIAAVLPLAAGAKKLAIVPIPKKEEKAPTSSAPDPTADAISDADVGF